MLALLLVAIPVAPISTAQEHWQDWNVGEDISWPLLADVCPRDLPVPVTSAVADEQCGDVDVVPLAQTQTGTWFHVQYRRRAVLTYFGEFQDTADLDEVLLVRRDANSPSAIIEAHVGRDRRFEFIRGVTWSVVDGAPIVTLRLCLNGTGGCGEYYATLVSGRWREVVQQFIDELVQHLPVGYRLHKARQIDLTTMRGSWGLAGPDDGNCCPSGEIRFILGFGDGVLRLERIVEVLVPEVPPNRSVQSQAGRFKGNH